MKRLILALALMFIFISISVWGISYINKTDTQINNILDECNVAIEKEDFPHSQQLLKKLKDEWEEKEIYLSLLIHEEKITALFETIVLLEESILKKDSTEAQTLISHCRSKLEEIVDNEKININNIL